MDIDYKAVIDFSLLKKTLDDRGMRTNFLAAKVGEDQTRISAIYRNVTFPKTDLIARICSVLNVPASQVVEFKEIKTDAQKKVWFESHAVPYQPEGEVKCELTYEPMRAMMNMYLDYLYENTGKEKTINDLYDLIEPYRRRNGLDVDKSLIHKASVEKKFGEDYKSARTNRAYHAKGLTPQTRNKIKTDQPLNIRAVYDICNFFGCSIDWVMSYK